VTTLLIRPNRNEADQVALTALGVTTRVDPYLSIEQVDNPEGALRLIDALSTGAPCWLIVTSANAWHYWVSQTPPGAVEELMETSTSIRYAAIGEQTASILQELGVLNVLVPDTKNARSLADLLVVTQPCPVVLPAGSISMRSIPDTLIPAGFTLVEEVFYRTEPVQDTPETAGRLVELGIDSVLLRSPSAAQAFILANPEREPGVALICGGLTTAERLRSLGVEPDVVCSDPSPQAVALATATYLGKL
jgi:uroporphyrinogen-III synthase